MFAAVQSGEQPAMSYRNCSSTRCPAWECSTSGCHCTPAKPRPASSNAAIGAPALLARAVKPAGAAATESPWLIQTRRLSGSPASRVPGIAILASVRPNSLSPVRATSPPRARAIAWNP